MPWSAAALLSNRLGKARRYTHDDVVLHVPGSHPLAGEHRGPEGLVRRTDHAAAYLRVTAERAGKASLDNTAVNEFWG